MKNLTATNQDNKDSKNKPCRVLPAILENFKTGERYFLFQ